jgi:hypothetical protein
MRGQNNQPIVYYPSSINRRACYTLIAPTVTPMAKKYTPMRKPTRCGYALMGYRAREIHGVMQ